MSGRLSRRFYRQDPVTLAKALLGSVLVRRLDSGERLSGRIVEVEAYLGVADRAAHSFGGRETKRNASMYLDGGHAYVYFVYGMHWCFNVVSERESVPTACLIRALEPLTGIETMRRHRRQTRETALCSGPAKLAQALGIDRALDAADLTSSKSIHIRPGRPPNEAEVAVGPRVGVDYAGEWALRPLRFWLEGSGHVSRAPKRRKAPPP